MALTLDYPDAYLARFCTDDREARALADVDLMPTFTATWSDAGAKTSWRAKVGRIKCYILACIENQAAPDDLFSAKLKSYRSELESVSALAEAARTASTGGSGLLFAVPLERA